MPQFEPQISGVVAARRPEGNVLARPTRDRLIQVPPYILSWHSDVTGGSGVVAVQDVLSNPDGSGMGINVSVPAGTGTTGAEFWVPFRGACFGIRWRRAQALSGGDFSVAVDGEWFDIPADENFMVVEGFVLREDDYAMVLLAEDLDPTVLHHARVRLVGHATLARSLVIFGWLLDAAAGYVQPERVASIPSTAAVPTVQTEIPTNRNNNNSVNGIREIRYVNTGGTDRVITIQNTGVTMDFVAVPAGKSVPYTLNMPVVPKSTLTHAADGADVNFTVLGPAY